MERPELDEASYAYLRELAGRIHAERGGRNDSIQPTALLHEAWARLANRDGMYKDRAHFLATAARAMRFIMVDRARARARLKRGDRAMRTTLSGVSSGQAQAIDLLDLEDALNELARLDPVAADVVTLRVYGGLTLEEISENIGLSSRTLQKRWRYARVWLSKRLE